MRKIRIGSRESRLAVIQAEIVESAIRARHPEIETEIITMKTTGDRILDRTLDQIGGKGLFVKELDAALLEGRVDITVHSSKDLPMETDPRLPLVAFSPRQDARDVLVLPAGCTEMPAGRPIGSASLRRTLQLRELFPGVEIAPVRGNVQTRLQKLDRGDYCALVLAAAGRERLGLTDRISRRFSVSEILPAAGQGILAVQSRAGFDTDFLREFHDAGAAACITAERAFVRTLDGGCSSPVAAHAVLEGEKLCLTGFYVNAAGAWFKDSCAGGMDAAEDLGTELALRMRREHP